MYSIAHIQMDVKVYEGKFLVCIGEGAIVDLAWNFTRQIAMALLPERLADLREKRGLTQIQLAERVGTNQQTIGRYETGKRSPKVDMIARLADALAPCTVSYLIGRSPIPEGATEDLSPDERELIDTIRRRGDGQTIQMLLMTLAKQVSIKRRKIGGNR